MFLVNSRLGRFAATPSGSHRAGVHPTGALLLPKLRSQLAEFLNEGSPVHLSMLYRPTCVGLRYGHSTFWLEAFPGSSGPTHLSLAYDRLTITSQTWPGGFPSRAALPAWTTLVAGPTSLRPPIAHNDRLWYWNVDQLSIAYACRPRLRPDSPAADQHGCGTLRPSVGRIRTALALLIPAFALVAAPAVFPLDLPC